jgi:hypothetical protein
MGGFGQFWAVPKPAGEFRFLIRLSKSRVANIRREAIPLYIPGALRAWFTNGATSFDETSTAAQKRGK